MKTIDKLLNAGVDKKIGNYKIKFYDYRKAKLYHYDTLLMDINFGDNFARGGCFKVQDSVKLERSSVAAINYATSELSKAGFKEMF